MMPNTQRPWPVPNTPWIMKQSWYDLLFLHYPIPVQALLPYVPPGMHLDTFNNTAWISVVPFWMSGIRFRGTPAVPYLSQFPEINVRTYVTVDDKPGVYFFSLDAQSRIGVFFGKNFYKLPYYYSKMSVSHKGKDILYASARTEDPSIQFQARYKPVSDVFQAEKGTLDYWLVERYCLAAYDNHRTYLSEINHKPWQLQRADYSVTQNTMLHPFGISLPDTYCAHFSKRIDVHVWPLK
jgi:uncharacterized protein YqjF (DUF2071 family)